MNQNKIAIIGANSDIARETLSILSEKGVPVSHIYAVVNTDLIGIKVSFGDNGELTAISSADINFSAIDIVFLCTTDKDMFCAIEEAKKNNTIIIDVVGILKGDDVVSIIPQVNPQQLDKKAIFANPNSCSVLLALVLKPLNNFAKVKRIVISTYESTSGAGREAMDELYQQTKSKYIFGSVEPKILPQTIAFNLFPQVGEFCRDGYTDHELKIIHDLTSLLNCDISITITCVRVPIFVGDSIAVNVEFEGPIETAEIFEVLSEYDYIVVVDDNLEAKEIRYATPNIVSGEDAIYVSRIRRDLSHHNSINMWIVADNIRRAGAINAVEILEELLRINRI